MDRHVLWLRRRLMAYVLTETAKTFGIAFVVLAVLLAWRSGLGLTASIALGFVLAQLIAGARIVWAIRNNPRGYSFLKNYIDAEHSYVICEGDDQPHEMSKELLGFYRVVAVHDPSIVPPPVFDLFQTADRVTTATVSRASGAASFMSRLDDGRLLLTDSRMVMPNEGLIVNLVEDKHPSLLIAAHQTALDKLPIVSCPEPLAVKVTSRALELEHRSYSQLGAALGSFLDVEPYNPPKWRLVLRLVRGELLRLAFPKGGPRQPAAPEVAPTAIQAVAVAEPMPLGAPVDAVVADTITETALETGDAVEPQDAPDVTPLPETAETVVEAEPEAHAGGAPGGFVGSTGESISYFAPPPPDHLPVIRPSTIAISPSDRSLAGSNGVNDSGGESLAFQLATRIVSPAPIEVNSQSEPSPATVAPPQELEQMAPPPQAPAEPVAAARLEEPGGDTPPLASLPPEPARVQWVTEVDLTPEPQPAPVPVPDVVLAVMPTPDLPEAVPVMWVAEESPEPTATEAPVAIEEPKDPMAAIPVVPVVPVPVVARRLMPAPITRRAAVSLPPAVYSVDSGPCFDAERPESELVELTSG